jgi:hypothetical protein
MKYNVNKRKYSNYFVNMLSILIVTVFRHERVAKNPNKKYNDYE